MNTKTLLGQLRLLAIFEGISYLLFALTMPMKYLMDMGTPNKIVGMIHGVLFIAYVIWVLLVGQQKKWGIRMTIICLIASLLPVATFIVDSKFLKPLQQRT